MQAPPELVGLLEQAGAPWPEADENQLQTIAEQWGRLAGNLSGLADDAARVTQRIRSADQGASVDAFSAHQSEFHKYMTSGVDAANAVASGVRAYMKGTIALKKETVTVLQKTYGVLRKIAGPLIKLAAPLFKLVKPIIDKILSWAKQAIESMFKRLWQFVVQTLGPLFKRAAGELGKVIAFLRRYFGGKPTGPVKDKWNGNHPPKQAVAKVPPQWGQGDPTSKAKGGKPGWRWADPSKPKGMCIRIDKGDPRSRWPSQRVDHVVIIYNGRVIGPDGRPIDSPKPSKEASAHIPLSQWLKWKTWNSP